MQRITIKDLETVCEQINKTLSMPLEPYTRDKSGKLRANIGNFHLSGAYGGWGLHRMNNQGGGISDVLGSGYISKKELYYQMKAYLRGL